MAEDGIDRLSDETLLTRYQLTREERCFHELVRRYGPTALAFARARLGGMDGGDDAVQEAFIRVAREVGRYDGSRAFAPWFYTILRNICTDTMRKRVRYRDKLKAFSVEPRNRHRREPDMTGIEEAIHSLPEPDRDILMLRLVQGLSFGEIAGAVSCTEDAAKKRAQRALRRLREKLQV